VRRGQNPSGAFDGVLLLRTAILAALGSPLFGFRPPGGSLRQFHRWFSSAFIGRLYFFLQVISDLLAELS